MAGRFSIPRAQVFDENGDPLAGAKLGFFVSGTSTPQNTYSDDALTIPNTNPVIADSAGRFGDIFLLDADYKVTLSEADDTVVWTADPVRSADAKSSEVRTVTTTTVLDSSDDGKLIAADATAGPFIITLPPAATAGNGYEVTIQKIDSGSNVVTVDADGSETINGQASLTLPDQYASFTIRCNGTTWFAYAITPTVSNRILPPDFITGYTITNNSTDPDHDIDVAVGSTRGDADNGNILLTSALVKQIDAAFAEGTNNGMLDTGTVAANTVYYIFAIGKADGTADILASTSKFAPTLPSGFIYKRRIGWIKTDGSANILGTFLGQVLSSGQRLTLEVEVNSGTVTEFVQNGEMPDGVQKIVVNGFNLETGSANQIGRLRLGTTAMVTGGYDSRALEQGGGTTSQTSRTDGMAITSNVFWDAAVTLNFTATFTRAPGDIWNMGSLGTLGSSPPALISANGTVPLTADAQRMQIATVGAATFQGSGLLRIEATSWI